MIFIRDAITVCNGIKREALSAVKAMLNFITQSNSFSIIDIVSIMVIHTIHFI